MLKLSIQQKNNKYIPTVEFLPNAQVSLRQFALIAALIQNGGFYHSVLALAKSELSDEQLEKFAQYIVAITNVASSKGDDQELVEAAKVPIVSSDEISHD